LIALISDIHANFEALCAVMGDIENQDVESIFCLGDIVGYGPDPEKCTDLVIQEAKRTIMGNHDFALLNVPFGFNPIAAEVIRKTQEIMRPVSHEDKPDAASSEPLYYACMTRENIPPCIIMEQSKPDRWAFFKGLPEKFEHGEVLYVHGSPLDPTFEYVFPDSYKSAWNPDRIGELMRSVRRICFCGHTHMPCAITSDAQCIHPSQCNSQLSLDPRKKYIINSGSVGQPRDGDNRACYLLFDPENRRIEWRRVSYDIEPVIKKIEAMCGKGNWCGARLRSGR
jgi:predicted phosphodiesterase